MEPSWQVSELALKFRSDSQETQTLNDNLFSNEVQVITQNFNALRYKQESCLQTIMEHYFQ